MNLIFHFWDSVLAIPQEQLTGFRWRADVKRAELTTNDGQLVPVTDSLEYVVRQFIEKEQGR